MHRYYNPDLTLTLNYDHDPNTNNVHKLCGVYVKKKFFGGEYPCLFLTICDITSQCSYYLNVINYAGKLQV